MDIISFERVNQNPAEGGDSPDQAAGAACVPAVGGVPGVAAPDWPGARAWPAKTRARSNPSAPRCLAASTARSGADA